MRVGGGLETVSIDTLKNNNDLEQFKSLASDPKKKLGTADAAKKDKEADDVAKQFETMFVDMMMKGMRQTAKPEEESNAQGIYKGMLDDEYSKVMTDSQSFGIREMVKDWIKQNS